MSLKEKKKTRQRRPPASVKEKEPHWFKDRLTLYHKGALTLGGVIPGGKVTGLLGPSGAGFARERQHIATLHSVKQKMFCQSVNPEDKLDFMQAGKTTLLSVLASGDLGSGVCKQGSSRLVICDQETHRPNVVAEGEQELKKVTSYVPSCDHLPAYLTVAEHLLFSALLRLPHDVPPAHAKVCASVLLSFLDYMLQQQNGQQLLSCSRSIPQKSNTPQPALFPFPCPKYVKATLPSAGQERVLKATHDMGLVHTFNRIIGNPGGEASQQRAGLSASMVLSPVLGLLECGTRGTAMGLSNGERRRVTIAAEVLTQSGVIIMASGRFSQEDLHTDEPTSGLDSYSALSLLKVCHQLACAGPCVVLLSLHQPSTELISQLDQMLLLAPGGFLAYAGRNIQTKSSLCAACAWRSLALLLLILR
eukprot:1147439-Pelagomonas_calceolata.AAC.2